LPNWSAIARRIRVPLGFAFAAAYLWLAHPTWRSILEGAVVCVPGLWLRASASGHVQKNTQLTTSGPYAHTRNPLYLGSLLLAAGFAIAGRNWWIVAAMALFFLAVYLPVIRNEEAFLRATFPEYQDYERRVPRLFPQLRAAGATDGSFSPQLYWKHREYNSLLGTSAMMAALAIKLVWFRS